MSMSTTEAPTAARAWRFEGSAGEYFKIWIVNLALTIVTLGIFSAWAKVRSRRYFYGNTFIGDHAFDYHGAPLRILLGRVIALVLLLGYSLSVNFGGPMAAGAWGLVFLVALPWLVKTSLRFNARNTSYRNVRFDFHGTYGGAFWAFVMWLVFTVLSLGTLTPLAHRARDYYNINNHSYGGKAFAAVISGGRLYGIYFLGMLFFFAAIALIAGAFFAAGGLQVMAAIKPGANQPPSPALILLALMILPVYLVTFLFVGTFVRTMTFNLAVSSTRLDDSFQLGASVSPIAMTWIIISNLVVTLCTLGLMYPWAMVRQTRYIVEKMSIAGSSDLEGYASTVASQAGAVGEEVASFFDIDFGL